MLLGDLPADTTGRRLADAILSSMAPLLGGALAASIASAVVIGQGLLDSGAPASPAAVAAAAALPLAAALAPVAAPLLEVSKFAGMSAQQIEDTVRLKEPVQVSGGRRGKGRAGCEGSHRPLQRSRCRREAEGGMGQGRARWEVGLGARGGRGLVEGQG